MEQEGLRTARNRPHGAGVQVVDTTRRRGYHLRIPSLPGQGMNASAQGEIPVGSGRGFYSVQFPDQSTGFFESSELKRIPPEEVPADWREGKAFKSPNQLDDP